mgnify:CR=1 FL=1
MGHNPSAKATAAATATTATTESQSVQSDYTNNESHLHLVKARLLPLDIVFLTALSQAVFQYGLDMFKIHPKGTGIIVTAPEGIKPHIPGYLDIVGPSYIYMHFSTSNPSIEDLNVDTNVSIQLFSEFTLR